eukprot:COSAG01_NODE_45_length_32100_cov_28.037218_17_plen_359_part_00
MPSGSSSRQRSSRARTSPGQAAAGWGGRAPSVVAVPGVALEGSFDGKHWEEIPLRYLPGAADASVGPRRTAPLQPRIDWRMCLAATGTSQHEPWLTHLAVKLLHGGRQARALLDEDRCVLGHRAGCSERFALSDTSLSMHRLQVPIHPPEPQVYAGTTVPLGLHAHCLAVGVTHPRRDARASERHVSRTLVATRTPRRVLPCTNGRQPINVAALAQVWLARILAGAAAMWRRVLRRCRGATAVSASSPPATPAPGEFRAGCGWGVVRAGGARATAQHSAAARSGLDTDAARDPLRARRRQLAKLDGSTGHSVGHHLFLRCAPCSFAGPRRRTDFAAQDIGSVSVASGAATTSLGSTTV